VASIPRSPPNLGANGDAGPYARVGPPWWTGKPVAIVGNGPSIRGFDCKRLRGGFHVLAVKGAMFNIPWADAGFGLDNPRYCEWSNMLHTVRCPVYWATNKLKFLGDGPHAPCMRFLRRIDISNLSDDPGAICSGGSSGFGAVNLAWLKRSRRMILLGFDYDTEKGHADLRAYLQNRSQCPAAWFTWAKNFDRMKRDIDVQGGATIINASPQSRIAAFPKMDIEAALAAIQEAKAA
jgi:hypothetical protein